MSRSDIIKGFGVALSTIVLLGGVVYSQGRDANRMDSLSVKDAALELRIEALEKARQEDRQILTRMETNVEWIRDALEANKLSP